MQKYILSLIILLSSSQIFAQGLSFSVVLDPQMTWMDSDSKKVEREGSNFGIGGGLVMDLYFAENYAFTSGLQILSTGGNLTFLDSIPIKPGGIIETLPAGSTVEYKLQYLVIPFGLKLKSNEIGYFRFFADLGILNQINLKATGTVESSGINGEDISDDIGFFMISYYIGGGLEYSLGGNTALIGGLYWNSGIWDVNTNQLYRAHISSIALRLGIKF
ncbi:MAG TPA: PorT family protein [Bacteroides sp.]|nr:PorT family protein [Bacteroides sp.]